MSIDLLARTRIQAEVLVPLLRAFRAELGEDEANRIAWKSLAEWRRNLVRDLHAGFEGSPAERWRAGFEALGQSVGSAVDAEMLRNDEEAVELDMTGCRFADFFRELGEPELGFAMLCSLDETAAEEIGGDEVRFRRTGTIMQGASRCDFRYALRRNR